MNILENLRVSNVSKFFLCSGQSPERWKQIRRYTFLNEFIKMLVECNLRWWVKSGSTYQSKSITSRQINDITITYIIIQQWWNWNAEVLCHSKLFLRLTFLSTKFVAEGRNCKYLWFRLRSATSFSFRNWGPTLALTTPYNFYTQLLKTKTFKNSWKPLLEKLRLDRLMVRLSKLYQKF